MKNSTRIYLSIVLFSLISCSHVVKKSDPTLPPPEESTLTDEKEYELGRDVSAEILKSYPPLGGSFNTYGTQVSKYLAQYSIRPSTYKGYRLQLIESTQKSAYSTPGGFIYISDSLLDSLQSEDELAGVIAHEISHIALRHGEMAINQGADAEKQVENTSKGLSFMSHLFGGASKIAKQSNSNSKLSSKLDAMSNISNKADVLYKSGVGKVHEKILKSGYSQEQETAADTMAVDILLKTGYNPNAFSSFLTRELASPQSKNGAGWITGSLFATHPLNTERVELIKNKCSKWKSGPASPVRDLRFKNAKNASRVKEI
jgi:hypothetical protein